MMSLRPVKIFLGADHAGFCLKNVLRDYLCQSAYEVVDCGTYSPDSCDYPLFATKVTESIACAIDECGDEKNTADHVRGILICGTGVGMSIAANRYSCIRAALCYNEDMVRLARQHNNANIAVFGGRMMSVEDMEKRLDIFLNTGFEGGRHLRRIEKIDVYGGCSNVGL